MSLFGFIPFVFDTASAQSATNVSAEAGTMLIEQPKTTVSPVAFVLLDARRSTRVTAVSGSALFAQAANSSATQGQLGAELALPVLPALRAELSATATKFDALSNRAGNSRNGYVRPQFVRERFGMSGLFGAGVTSRGKDHFHARAGDVGVWVGHGRFTGSANVRQSYTTDYDLVEGSGLILARQARHYSIRDFTGVLSVALPSTELQVSSSRRRGFAETRGSSNAVFAAATIHVTTRFDVSLNGGKQLADLLTGVPQSYIAGASLRVQLLGRARTHFAAIAAADTKPTTAAASPFATQIRRHVTGGATVVVRVDAHPDAQVEISGTFNDWNAVLVARSANGFEHTIELPPGTHRIAVRVNGGEWKAPVGLARITDDLGGEAGLIIVP